MKSVYLILLFLISTISYSQIKFISIEAGLNNTQLITKNESQNSESVGKFGYNFLAKGTIFRHVRLAMTVDALFRFSNSNSEIKSNLFFMDNFNPSHLDYNGYLYSAKYDQISFGLGFDRRWYLSNKVNLMTGGTILYNKITTQRVKVSIDGNEIDPSNYNVTDIDNPISYENKLSGIFYLGIEYHLEKNIYPIININYEIQQDVFLSYTEESYRVGRIGFNIGLAYKFIK